MDVTDHDRQLSESVGGALGLVMGATMRAAALYLEEGLSAEPVRPDARRAILDELVLVATVLRAVDAHRELLGRLTGVLDPAPTVAVLRAIQDSLILALAPDARQRAHRIGEQELRARLRAETVRRFLDQRTT